jgi:hypothetical protein
VERKGSLPWLGAVSPLAGRGAKVARRRVARTFSVMSTEAPRRIARLRRNYCPRDVRILFVGESPPAGGTFFYAANSNLFVHTQAAFVRALGRGVGDGETFLQYFKGLGCYLEDLCCQPVNRLAGTTRQRAHRNAMGDFVRRVRRHSPDAIVVVSRAIREPVAGALDQAGLGHVPRYELPFPAFGHHTEYIRGLSELLVKWLRRVDHPAVGH